LHTLASGHGVASGSTVCVHPFCGSQASTVHAFASSQTSDAAGVHVPARHVSLPLHRLPSGQGAPFASTTCVQPVTGSQPSVVHGLASSQDAAAPAVHCPAAQVSAPLHWLPSLHDVPSASGTCTHPVSGLHASAVQGLPSSHWRGAPGVHPPPAHVSAPLHG